MFARLFLTLLFLFIMACNGHKETEQEECAMVVCTEIYVTLTVSIKNTSGDIIALDSFEVVDTNTGKNLTENYSDPEYQYYKEQGLYPIFSDKYHEQYKNSEAVISFKGYVSNNKVVDQEFIVGADCCHVNLISGPSEIVLD